MSGATACTTCGSGVPWTLGPHSYWWPNVPYRSGYQAKLHRLEITLSQNGRVVHQSTLQFGFRQFEAQGSHYYLNGIQCNLRGDNQQEADFGTDAYGIRPGFVVICPFAGGLFEKQDKTWPAFAEFTQALHTLGRDVVACPGPGEDDIITAGHPGVHLLPGVKLGTYGGLLRRAVLVVSNDTGPAHLAAAVATPVLSVLGPTKPEQWAPWGPQVRVLRHWPRWPTVDEAMAEVDAALQRPPQAIGG